ncbi:AMINO ACID TRANSPORTER [Salix purpurea]|uniref:AMINO ACID TRANSPORTER n=1 Tax=Salix purpurea TaxID=77065 RepID=A0A9Q0VWB2_SALPP|nr:AMINO ACID TRANSPORTER [Salix purpurea]
MAIVVKEDIDKVISGEFRFGDRTAITSSIGGLPFAGGMAVFCFEGFGMTLSLEASMKEKGGFASLLAKTFSGITLLYVLFGFSGYMAYGDETKDIITLNLPHNWSTIAVQVGLCLGLTFTFPIMAHPIHEIVEGKLRNSEWIRKVSYKEATFHLKLFGSSLRFWQKALDYVFLIGGLLLAAHGTYNSIVGF